MHVIAKLSDQTDRETGEVYLGGKLRVGTIKAPVRLIETEKRGKNSPSHHVEIWRNGEWHPFGVAWKQAPHGGGEDYYSARMSHPMWMRHEMPVTVFPPAEDADEGQWSMVWRPAQPKAAGDPLANDAVMF